MLAVTLSFIALLYLTGIRADRTKLTSPGIANATRSNEGLYRGKPATYWASRFRQRTRQLQISRRALKQSLAFPVYGLDRLERAFMCIHGFEGSWTDPNAPFYGGLQMDLTFQRSYGAWALRAFGTADHWPVSVQLSTAIQAYFSGRGFHPWPNTARYCGLL